MSITVADVMKLPSMRGAKGAWRRRRVDEGGIVHLRIGIRADQRNPGGAVRPRRISRQRAGQSTGFMNNPDDVELQCTNLRRMAAIGEVGVILFYVGIVMKKVDRQLIEVATRLIFP